MNINDLKRERMQLGEAELHQLLNDVEIINKKIFIYGNVNNNTIFVYDHSSNNIKISFNAIKDIKNIFKEYIDFEKLIIYFFEKHFHFKIINVLTWI